MVKIKILLVVLLLLAPVVVRAADHPTEIAEAKLDAAEKSLKAAFTRVNKAIALVDDASKRKKAAAAFAEAQKRWQKSVEADTAVYSSASTMPDTSTAAMLEVYTIEANASLARTKELTRLAEWLEANHQ